MKYSNAKLETFSVVSSDASTILGYLRNSFGHVGKFSDILVFLGLNHAHLALKRNWQGILNGFLGGYSCRHRI